MDKIKNKTIYAVTGRKAGTDRESTFVGTLSYLVEHVYGYTIECNGYYKGNVKSLRTLLNYLNNGRSYWSYNTIYTGRKATAEEITKFKEEHNVA